MTGPGSQLYRGLGFPAVTAGCCNRPGPSDLI